MRKATPCHFPVLFSISVLRCSICHLPTKDISVDSTATPLAFNSKYFKIWQRVSLVFFWQDNRPAHTGKDKKWNLHNIWQPILAPNFVFVYLCICFLWICIFLYLCFSIIVYLYICVFLSCVSWQVLNLPLASWFSSEAWISRLFQGFEDCQGSSCPS